MILMTNEKRQYQDMFCNLLCRSPGGAGGVKRKRAKKEKEGEVLEPLSTDLQCYFLCDEVTKTINIFNITFFSNQG